MSDLRIMIVDKIQAYLAGEAVSVSDGILAHIEQLASRSFARQFGASDTKGASIRLSSIGSCLRQQAYKLLEFPPLGKEVDARSKMVFFQGDMAELALVQLARLAGCRITACGLGQITVDLDGIPGHPDGILLDAQKLYLVEVKSMSSYGFEKFQAGEIDMGYVYQINAYLESLGLTECVVVALNKDAGVLHEMMVLKDQGIVKDIRNRIAILKGDLVTQEGLNLPPRAFQADKKGFLPWNCAYCFAWGHCWTQASRVVVNKSYKLKVSEANENV